MGENETLSKGELMEELIRSYFIKAGYFVLRGVKFNYKGNEITDVDLYLYGRSSSLTRERINVDIKNKKSPQAFERILWSNGLRELLGFDSCIVATSDKRAVIQTFGRLHNTLILDGTFLSKLKSNPYPNRLYEEDLLLELAKHKSYKTFKNKDWRYIYEDSKSKLLNELDYSGFNSQLLYLKYFLEKTITDIKKISASTRMIFLILAHILITMDFLLKDIAFLDTSEREKRISDGLRYGNLGQDGVNTIISMAVQISGNKSANNYLNALDQVPTDILKEFFSKNEYARNLFNLAKNCELIGYHKELVNPEMIDSPLKSILGLFLDYFSIPRKEFFKQYDRASQIRLPLDQETKNSEDTKK